jgi:hypothetical protein
VVKRGRVKIIAEKNGEIRADIAQEIIQQRQPQQDAEQA